MTRTVHDHRREAVRALDLLAAALIAAGGYLHYCLYRNGYRVIPTIGTAFLLQVIASGVLALALSLPLAFALRVGHWEVRLSTATRIAGIGLSIGTLVAFLLSRLPGGIFNFQERGLQPSPQSLITLITEAGAALVLAAALLLAAFARRPAPRPALSGRRPPSRV